MILTTEKPKRQNAAFKHLMALHWIMATFIFSLYVTGIFVAHPRQTPVLDWLIPFLHQSFGILVLMLLIARIFLLLRLVKHRYSRRSPKVTSKWLKPIILHSSLYFFMLLVPISGFLLRNFIGLDTTFFGIPIPSVFVSSKTWIELARNSHFWLSYVFLVFILLHVLAHWKIVWINVKKHFTYVTRAFFREEV